MANPKNLISPEELNARLTPEERKENASKAGKASGKARRERKKLREQMEMLLSLPASDENKAKMKAMGIEEADQNNQMALIIAMAAQGLKGDVAAFNSIRDLIGEKPTASIALNGVNSEKLDDIMAQIGGEGLEE